MRITIAIVRLGDDRVPLATTGNLFKDAYDNPTISKLLYAEGMRKPRYPMPAKTTEQYHGAYVSYANWYSNVDKFWTNYGARHIAY